MLVLIAVDTMLHKNTWGIKKVQGQSEAALQTGRCDQKYKSVAAACMENFQLF